MSWNVSNSRNNETKTSEPRERVVHTVPPSASPTRSSARQGLGPWPAGLSAGDRAQDCVSRSQFPCTLGRRPATLVCHSRARTWPRTDRQTAITAGRAAGAALPPARALLPAVCPCRVLQQKGPVLAMGRMPLPRLLRLCEPDRFRRLPSTIETRHSRRLQDSCFLKAPSI